MSSEQAESRSKREELVETIKNMPSNQLYADLETNFCYPKKFNKFVERIFYACDSDEDWAKKKKAKTIARCLKLLQQKENEISSDQYNQIANKINTLIKGCELQVNSLIQICDILVECLEKYDKTSDRTSWQYLMPTVLNKISAFDKQEYQDDLVNAGEYNAQIIGQLLQMKWTQKKIVLLAEMFLHIQLTADETNKIIFKFMDCLRWLELDTIPPLVHHLLKLSSSNGSHFLLIKLQQYFGGAIYDMHNSVGSTYSESLCNDDPERSQRKLMECEGNVMYHISKATGCNSVQSYMDHLKNSKLYEIALHPFNFTLMILLSAECEQKELLEVIKSAIIRYYIEEQMREKCFFREMASQRIDLLSIIKIGLDSNRSHHDIVLGGMVNLAFELLTTNIQFGHEDILPKLYRIATLILVRIIEVKNSMIKRVAADFVKALRVGRNPTLIIDCFACIAGKFKYILLRNVIDIYDTFDSATNYEVNSYLEVIMSMARFNPSLKEHVMKMLHASVESNEQRTGIHIVITYMQLLKHLKVSSEEALSQSDSNSQLSISTQMSLTRTMNSSLNHVTFSNEAICNEVIADMQRIFSYCNEAIVYMYRSLPDVVDRNLELKGIIWDFLWKALGDNLSDALPPINFENISKIEDTECVPVRSVSELIMALVLILLKLPEDYQNSFDDIASEMAKCDVEHFKQDADLVLTDGSPESQAQIYIIHEAINTYDALMTYYILSWSPETMNSEQTIKNLFQVQKRLTDFIRTYQRGKKKDMSQSKSSTINNTTRNITANKKLRLPNSIMPLHCLDKAIELLYCDSVEWTGFENGKTLKVLVSFHHHILESLIHLAQTITQNKDFLLKNMSYWEQHFGSVEKNLYKYCVKKQEQLQEFNITTAALALEAFYHVLVAKQFILEKFGDAPNYILTTDEAAKAVTMDFVALKDYLTTYQELLKSIDDNVTDDIDSVRIASVVVNTIALLADRIPLAEKMFAQKFIEWMKTTCRGTCLQSKLAANNLVASLIKISTRFTSSTIILRLIVNALGASIGWISETDTEGAEMEMINSITSCAVLQTVLNEVKNHHDEISWIMRRIKLEYDYFIYANLSSITSDHQRVKRKERNVCSKLIEVTTLLTNINNLNVHGKPGNLAEKILHSTVNIFKLLTTLTNYFHGTSAPNKLAFQDANFDGLVRHTMKKLVPAVYQQIQSTEESQQTNKNIKSMPNVILGIESFKKSVVKLSIKTKVEVYNNLGVGVVRGFRVKGLEQLVGDQEKNSEDAEDSIMSEDAGAGLSSIGEHSSDEESNDTVPIPTKRMRK